MSGRAVAALSSPLNRFKVGAAATLGTDVIGRGLSLVATIMFIRGLSVTSYSYVVLFLAVGQFVGSSATGGVRMRYLRTEAERVSRGDTVELTFLSALLGSLGVVAGIALVAAGCAAVLDIAVDARFLALAAGFAAAQGAIELAIYHHQAHLAFLRAGWVSIARGFALAVVAALVTAGLTRSGAAAAALVTLATGLVATIACWQPVGRITAWRPHIMQPRVNLESVWLGVYSVASAGFATVDVFVVAALLTHRDVATFGAAQRYYAFALGAAPALTAVLRVRTAQHDIMDSPRSQADLLRNWVRRAWLPAVIVGTVLALAAQFLIPVIDGGRYPESIPVLQILLLGVAAYYVMLPAPSLLMSQRRYDALALTVLAALAVNCIGDFTAVRVFDAGIVGVAVIASVTYVGFFVGTVVLAVRGTARSTALARVTELAA